MNENPLFETAKCTQLGILVHDIEKSSQAYAAFLGVPVPPVQMTGVYEDAHTTYLGQPTKARCKQAFFYYGDLEVELLDPTTSPASGARPWTKTARASTMWLSVSRGWTR